MRMARRSSKSAARIQSVVLDADLSSSTRTAASQGFPDRFIMSDSGGQHGRHGGWLGGERLVPFIHSFACSSPAKGTTVSGWRSPSADECEGGRLARPASASAEDGVSQQSIEDIALMTSLPNFVVMVPSDEHATRALTKAAARACRPGVYPHLPPESADRPHRSPNFEIGKGSTAPGQGRHPRRDRAPRWEALSAAEQLAARGIERPHRYPPIKPLDTVLLAEQAKTHRRGGRRPRSTRSGGGLGSAWPKRSARTQPVPMEFVAIQDTYVSPVSRNELSSGTA